MTTKRGIKIAMFSNLSDEADNPDGCGSNIAYAYFTTFFVSPLICDVTHADNLYIASPKKWIVW